MKLDIVGIGLYVNELDSKDSSKVGFSKIEISSEENDKDHWRKQIKQLWIIEFFVVNQTCRSVVLMYRPREDLDCSLLGQ